MRYEICLLALSFNNISVANNRTEPEYNCDVTFSVCVCCNRRSELWQITINGQCFWTRATATTYTGPSSYIRRSLIHIDSRIQREGNKRKRKFASHIYAWHDTHVFCALPLPFVSIAGPQVFSCASLRMRLCCATLHCNLKIYEILLNCCFFSPSVLIPILLWNNLFSGRKWRVKVRVETKFIANRKVARFFPFSSTTRKSRFPFSRFWVRCCWSVFIPVRKFMTSI